MTAVINMHIIYMFFQRSKTFQLELDLALHDVMTGVICVTFFF